MNLSFSFPIKNAKDLAHLLYPLNQTHIFCKKGQGRPKRGLAGGTHNVRRPQLWLGFFCAEAKLEPSSPQWLPELAGGQLQTELCELVEVGWKWGGEGRKVEPRKQGRLVEVSRGCLEIWAPQKRDCFYFIFFVKRLTFCFDCSGEAVIGPRWDGGLGGLCLSFSLFSFKRSIELEFASSLSFFGVFH